MDRIIGYLKANINRLNEEWKEQYRLGDYGTANAIYDDLKDFKRTLEWCESNKEITNG